MQIVKPSLAIFVKYEYWYFFLREINREQKEEIDRLEDEIDRLEILVRSLTQQNMDVGQEALRVRRELDELMAEHHQLLGRLKGRGDVA